MVEPSTDDPGDEWVIEEGVRCVVAPCCGFTFDAGHTDVDGGGYSCPCCAEIALTAERDRLREALAAVVNLHDSTRTRVLLDLPDSVEIHTGNLLAEAVWDAARAALSNAHT